MHSDGDNTRTNVPLTNGTMVSHYRIIEKIGAGGMGEVYRAEDTNLGRQVAIKVLPDLLGGDAERSARFEREAKLLAVLNHPNLATVYGFESVQGKRFLVMELVEGETLAERIAKGPLPLDDALDVLRQIAAGMEAAHENGIIHRDLKPANIKITPDGKVKILDFGLAKVLHGETAGSDLANSPTITENMTRAGVILGTAAYMSPEQAKGRPVDKRTDIWAFGCIVYECLTAKRAFEGETTSETLAAILRGEPDWNRLPSETPLQIRYLLSRCLQKDANRRLRDIGDAVFDSPDHAIQPSGIPVKPGRLRRTIIPWAIAVILLVVSAYFWYSSRGKQAVSLKPTISSILPPDNSVNCFHDGFALSPDGRKLAFSSISSKGERLIWVRALDQSQSISLSGTDGGTYPFWSPDSKNIAFYSGGWLKRIPAEGGSAQALCRSAPWYGGSWGSMGIILFLNADGKLAWVPETGGKPVAFAHGEEMIFPCFLPDGKHFLYTRWLGGSSVFQTSVEDSGLGTEIRETTNFNRAEWIPPDRLIYCLNLNRRWSLVAQQVDLSAGAMAGSRILLADWIAGPANWPAFSVCPARTLAYVPYEGGSDWPCRLAWLDRSGKLIGTLGEAASYWYARISPDGRKVIYSIEDDLRVFELASGLSRRVTQEMTTGNWAAIPLWSPQSDRVLAETHGSSWTEFPLSGGPSRMVFKDTSFLADRYLTSWSADGKYVLTDRYETGDNLYDIYCYDLTTKQLTPYLNTHFNEQRGQFSPDGRWVAYVSDETGSDEVYVRSFPDGSIVRRVSHSGGMHPRWRADGEELFFLAPGWTVMSAAINVHPQLEIGAPTALFQTTMADIVQGTISPYDVTPDGQRFLVIQPQTKPVPLTLVQNWQALVDRK